MKLEEFKQFLQTSNASSENKNYAYQFYQKFDYIINLYQQYPKVTKGFGNYNATIAFLFSSYEDYIQSYQTLVKILSEFNVSYYNMYTCIIDNTPLVTEHVLNAIAPKLIYNFSTQEFDLKTYARLRSSLCMSIDMSNLEKEEEKAKLKQINFYKELEVKE